MKSIFSVFVLLLLTIDVRSQNLPSLLLEKNINATFSILAYDKNAKEWGIVVATNNIYVGNSTIYIEPGKGAFAIIAETEPLYAVNGFKNLQSGKSVQEAIELTKLADDENYYRQVAGIDHKGEVYAFTGAALKYWQGVSGHLIGDQFVVMGNQLEKGVLEAMFKTYLGAKGTLAERLIASLTAGQQAGGQLQGKQSAALMVKGSANEWFNDIDLRVDHSVRPFQDLQKLLNYHYGRIYLNQAIYSIRHNNMERGKEQLKQASALLEGWNGIYSKIAFAHLLLSEEKMAIQFIKKGLAENPAWKENLAAFYLIKDHPDAKGLMEPKNFSEKDWANALTMMLNVGVIEKASQLSEVLLKQYPTSQMNFISGKSYMKLGNEKIAKQKLIKSLQLDQDNMEARGLLKQLDSVK